MPDQDNSPRSVRIATALLLFVAALWCLYWFVHAWGYWEDDAYIHLEFARSLDTGRGFAFNGRVVAGDTAPLWVFLLAGMHKLIPNWLVAGKTLTVLGAAFGLSGAYAYARRLGSLLLPSNFIAAIFPAAVVLLIVANPNTCYWIFSGMEPLTASGLAFWAMLSATRARPTTTSLLTASLMAGLAPLLRPEMIFFSALLLLPLIGQWRRLASSGTKPGTFVASLLLIASPVVLWSVYSLHAFGHLLPNTNAAKRAPVGESVVRHLVLLYTTGFPLIAFGVVAGIIYLLLHFGSVRRRFRQAIASTLSCSTEATQDYGLLLSIWIFVLWPSIATVFYIANHTYVQTRYVLATAPALTILVLLAVTARSRRGASALYAAALIAALSISSVIVRPFIRNKAINCGAVRDFALYMHDHLPPDAPVAVYAIGEIAFVSQHPIIDMGGITRPEAIPYLLAGSPNAMLRWLRSEGAQYYVGDSPESDAVLVYSVNERYTNWTAHTALFSTSQTMALWKLAPGPAR